MKTTNGNDNSGAGDGAGDELPITDRTRIRRRAQRGRYDRATVNAILDAAPVAHVGFVQDGVPFVIPMAFVRVDEALFLHGAAANRLLTAGAEGADLCVTATVLDGLVLARSAFHHSMNFRSVAVMGRARALAHPEEKLRALNALVDRLVPGRSRLARPPTPQELAATLVLRLPIQEASAKVRVGPPVDDPADLTWPVWAGVVPTALRAAAPLAAADSPPLPRLGPAHAAPTLTLLGPTVDNSPSSPVETTHLDYRLSDDRARVDLKRVTAWLATTYWTPGVGLDDVQRASGRSLMVAGAYAPSGEQVGTLRVVSDGARFAYLMDVFVASPHRGRGLGRALVRFALAHPDFKTVKRWMLGTRDAHGLYLKEGFQPLASAGTFMERLLEG